MVGVVTQDTENDGLVTNLVVNGVEVMPYVETELDCRRPVRLLIRSDQAGAPIAALQGAEVVDDRHWVEVHGFVQRPCWSVEPITPGPEGDDLQGMLPHGVHRVLTQGASETAPAMSLLHRQGVDLTVPTLQIDVPADVGRESAVDGLCHRNVLAMLWVMQFRDRSPVVVRPLAVLVFVDVGRNHRAKTLLVERAENLDREVNKRGQV